MVTQIAITSVRAMDHFRTSRNRSPSLPCRPVALVPTARFCGLIILPRTPPEELAPTVRFGLTPICWAVTFCKLARERVRGGVRSRESHPEPPDKTGEEREKDAGCGEREAKGVGQARVVQEVREPEDRGNREDRPLELVERLAVDPQGPTRPYPEDGQGDQVGYQDQCSGRREPVGREAGAVGRWLGYDRRLLLDHLVESWPGHGGQPGRRVHRGRGEVYGYLDAADGGLDRGHLRKQEERDDDYEGRPGVERASEGGVS